MYVESYHRWQPQVSRDDGWGIAPRTGIGQRTDGTVIFVIIDGRQIGWSMGATLTDLIKVFENYGAENAVSLGDASATEMSWAIAAD